MKELIQPITLFFTIIIVNGQDKSIPFFINGEAQVVESFKDQSKWIRHDLWVETSLTLTMMEKWIECMLV